MAKGSERARLRSERRAELEALARLMDDPAGRRWVRNTLAACHVWDTSFATNAIRMAFLEGERNQGLRLQAEIMEAAPEQFIEMLKEYGSERQRGANGAGGRSDDGDDDPWSEPGSDRTGFAE